MSSVIDLLKSALLNLFPLPTLWPSPSSTILHLPPFDLQSSVSHHLNIDLTLLNPLLLLSFTLYTSTSIFVYTKKSFANQGIFVPTRPPKGLTIYFIDLSKLNLRFQSYLELSLSDLYFLSVAIHPSILTLHDLSLPLTTLHPSIYLRHSIFDGRENKKGKMGGGKRGRREDK